MEDLVKFTKEIIIKEWGWFILVHVVAFSLIFFAGGCQPDHTVANEHESNCQVKEYYKNKWGEELFKCWD